MSMRNQKEWLLKYHYWLVDQYTIQTSAMKDGSSWK
jgi:hypothetical protein